MARRTKRGQSGWRSFPRRAGTHAFIYPTSEEEEETLPPVGSFAGKYRRGDKVRFHPIARQMVIRSRIPIDADAVMTIDRIIPAEENVQAEREAAMVKLPSGITTVIETDLLLPVGKNPLIEKERVTAAASYDRALREIVAARAASDPREKLHHNIEALKFAASATDHARKAGDSRLETYGRVAGHDAVENLKAMLRSSNPANIPGGSMSACIAIMETRPDVRDPGALCQWLAQRAGEYGSGFRMPSLKRKRMKPATRAAMRKLMGGT